MTRPLPGPAKHIVDERTERALCGTRRPRNFVGRQVVRHGRDRESLGKLCPRCEEALKA